MPAKLEPIPNEPIVIVTFDGHLDVNTVRQVFVDTAAIFANFEGDVYRIADIRTAKIGFGTGLRNHIHYFRNHEKRAATEVSDPPLFLGSRNVPMRVPVT